jgi:hypothetical protein
MSGINHRKCCCGGECGCSGNAHLLYAADWWVTKYPMHYSCDNAFITGPYGFGSYGTNRHIIPGFFRASGAVYPTCETGVITIPEFSYTFHPNDYFTGSCWMFPEEHGCPYGTVRPKVFLRLYLVVLDNGEEPLSKDACLRWWYDEYLGWGQCPVNYPTPDSPPYPPCDAHLPHAGYNVTQAANRRITVWGEGYTLHTPRDWHTNVRAWVQPMIELSPY